MTIEQKIATALDSQYLNDQVWSQMLTALTNVSTQKQKKLVKAVQKGQDRNLGKDVRNVVLAYLNGLALAEADEMMEDDVLDRDELNRILK